MVCSYFWGILEASGIGWRDLAMFWRLRETLMRFMAGRYGNDKLNTVLFWLYMILWLIGLFFRRGWVAWGLSVCGTLVAVMLLFRTLSRNIPRRQAENARFIRFWAPIAAWFRRLWVRLRDVRRHRYRVCPYCRAQLRLPLRRGRRTVTCSRCHSQFKAFFL